LALLRIRGNTMSDELMGHGSGYAFNAECEGGVFNH